MIHCQDTRKQAVAGTQARDSYPSHIIENADYYFQWSSCMWSYQQVELPEKKRWSAGLEGIFFLLEGLEITYNFDWMCGNFSPLNHLTGKFCPAFASCFLCCQEWHRGWGVCDLGRIFFPDTLPGTNCSNYSPWKSMVLEDDISFWGPCYF